MKPRNRTERVLADIWSELLGVERVGVRDNFFELGGDSLISIRVISRIEDRLGAKLPLTILLERATIEWLAGAMENGSPARWTSLVPIRETGSKTPLVCVHGAGHVLRYKYLADRIDPDRPVLGLQPVGLDGSEPPMERIEDIAAHYLRELRSYQPQGPYHLVGACVGSTICFEMARQLVEQGQPVGLLAVLDAPPPGPRAPSPALGTRARSYVSEHGRSTLRRLAQGIHRRLDQGAYRKLKKSWRRRFGNAETRRMAQIEHVQDVCLNAQAAYVPTPGAIPILQIRTAESAGKPRRSHHLGWRSLAPDLELHVIPARHRTMLLAPEVGHVARLIDARLEAIEREGG